MMLRDDGEESHTADAHEVMERQSWVIAGK